MPLPFPSPPAPAPVNPKLQWIDQELAQVATSYYEFQGNLKRVKYERVSGETDPQGYAYGFDIYEDEQTRTGDGSYVGAVVGTNGVNTTSWWVYRSKPTSVTSSPQARIADLADRLRNTAMTLRSSI